jgi:hypothetical protein
MLGGMGPDAKEAIPHLASKLNVESKEEVREAIEAALASIQG